jgi:hypothetical protein
VNRCGIIDSNNALDMDSRGPDHAGMERGDERSCCGVSMLRISEDPRHESIIRLGVVRVEVSMEGSVSDCKAASRSEPLESWLAHRRQSVDELRSSVSAGGR